ncbi:hypothetical protein M569_02355, partial [Genlisea aurea]
RTSGPTRRSTKGQWTQEEDEVLRIAVQRFKGKNWKKIAECFKDRTDVQCLHRWQKVLNPELVKGPWSKQEDEIIIQLVKKYGAKKWSTISQHLPGRIGKQCRERWHNHLNPNINKEAWTQNEELMLIRAHQIYGNKWAELTKFLPGRSDNAIKNHWNSSVKKKLEMYLASGLLSQFEGSPLRLPNQSMASSSSKAQQCSEADDFVGVDTAEMSECSQGSAAVSAPQPDMTGITHNREECGATENSSSVLCAEDYYPAFEEANFGIPEDQSGMGEQCRENDLCLDLDALSEADWHIDPNKLPEISLIDLGEEIPGLPLTSLSGPVDSSAAFDSSSSFDDMVVGDAPGLVADLEDRMLYSEVNRNEPGTSKTVNPEYGGQGDRLLHCPTFQIAAPESCCMPLDMLESALSESPPSSALRPPAETPSIFTEKLKQLSCSLQGNAGVYVSPRRRDDFVYSKESDSSPCADEVVFEGKESPRLVPANDFVLEQLNETHSSSPFEENFTAADKQAPGTLYYEPPRFPSLDIPFFSCDLIQSGSEIQQEYSPFGIRQLMMSSVTPFKLWDSPSRGDDASPEAVLKSAAKTFSGTPSILRKRHRDLMSPLSEKRDEKKPSNQDSFSSLADDFSKLDMLLDGFADAKGLPMPVSPKIKNLEVPCAEKENGGCIKTTGASKSIESNMLSDSTDASKTTEKDLGGVLVEHNINDLHFLSPHEFGSKAFGRRLDSKQQHVLPSSSENSFVSPRLGAKRDCSSGSKPIAASSSICRNSRCVDTAFKRRLESPSAWKSPWFLNTDITIEDFGYFVSPGECSYDAIGLMKQLGEHTAATFADAQEVLGDETPETIMKKAASSPSPSSNFFKRCILVWLQVERRVLDFSECGSP